MKKLLAIFSALLFFTISAKAQDFEMWPGATYDPVIPTLEDVVGHKIGERITWHGEMLTYLEALAAAAPDRMRLMDYGTTWEGRRLVYLAISNPENIANLEAFSNDMKRLADPRTTGQVEAGQLIERLPGSVWLQYAVHGNEISSTDAALMTAYHLLASRGDDMVNAIMENTIVFIDPLQNPDGRDRFVHNFEQAEGLEPDGSPLAAERDEPWPVGRTNHYLFDLNRDWIAATQPETKGRIRIMKEYFPLVAVDLHEMGTDSTYYFAPEAVPYNPHLAENQRSSLYLFGENNARWFDEFGFDYFTREVYDAFYPGYGASWPAYFGSIAMTYEQASARGLVGRKSTGVDLYYGETVRHHFVTSLSTAEVVANNREKLLQDFYNYRLTAIEEGNQEDVRAYIIPRQYDQAAANRLAKLMAFHGAEVTVASESFRACGTSYDAGSYVLDLAQPSKRMIRTFMDPDVEMGEAFLAEQERRRAKGLDTEIYDVTAWSLPLMFGVDAYACNRNIEVDGHFLDEEMPFEGGVIGESADFGYIVPWNSVASVRFLTKALDAGLDIISVQKAFIHDGKEYPSGSLVLKASENPEDLVRYVAQFAAESGIDAYAIDSSWVTEGPNFGSENAVRMRDVRVGIAWDEPTMIYQPGNTRYVIEQQFGLPVVPVRSNLLKYSDAGDLARFDVLILPEDGYFGTFASYLGDGGMSALSDWVNNGGVLIATGSAVRSVADTDVGFSALRSEETINAGEAHPEPEAGRVEASEITSLEEMRAMVRSETGAPEYVPGSIVKAHVDPDHWIGNGVKSELSVLYRASQIFRPLKLDEGVNGAYFAGPDDLVLSGKVWDESRRQLAFKPFVTVEPKGRGFVINFTTDPAVRAYLDGLNLIFANAILRGAANATPVH